MTPDEIIDKWKRVLLFTDELCPPVDEKDWEYVACACEDIESWLKDGEYFGFGNAGMFLGKILVPLVRTIARPLEFIEEEAYPIEYIRYGRPYTSRFITFSLTLAEFKLVKCRHLRENHRYTDEDRENCGKLSSNDEKIEVFMCVDPVEWRGDVSGFPSLWMMFTEDEMSEMVVDSTPLMC
jgi:hypothetical protein